jgi:hypothetical protein
MSFMMEIDAARAAQRSPLDLLAADFYRIRSGLPSIDFCRQAVGVPDSDETVARRLSVAISTVRGWREVGRRAGSPWACQ